MSARLHPQVEALLAAMADNPPPSYETLTPAEARAMARAFSPSNPAACQVGHVEHIAIPTEAGALTCRLYHPAPGGQQPPPAILFLHGGGWVVCDLDTHDDLCRRLCGATSAIVLSLAYRLAPETRFPGALEDAATALAWIRTQASTLGFNARKLFVSGDSAGGNLAAVLALLHGDLAGQILFYPVTDLGAEHPSYARMGAAPPLTTSTMRWFRAHYLGPDENGFDWRASPLRAPDLAHAPPCFIVTAGHDPLCDEGLAYASALAQTGVLVTHVHVPSQIHGFLSLAPVLTDGPAVIAMAGAWLRGLANQAAL
ncbi:alpha/beta hydrolase [Novosphingobium rosa]|uniref:alpha/beta hydrolase n=1 Tax=Novosphingobium rosa TaxID=76978 RepID=UPI000835BF5E|nr:alpha/beta hydrolase [Novosphingobium rosa]